MRYRWLRLIGAVCLFAAWAAAEERGPVAWWRFDDSATQVEDSLRGNARFAPGVSGTALKLDGFTAYVERKAQSAPKLSAAFAIEAWIAIQEYPLNWVALVDHDRVRQAGYLFGIDARGRLGLQAAVGGKWLECVSTAPLSLMAWHHVAGSWDQRGGMTLYVDGKPAGSLATTGSFAPADGIALRIGKNLEMLPPTDLVRAKVSLPSIYSFDGLIDELKIYDRALTASEVLRAASGAANLTPPLTARTWPRVNRMPKRFGAIHTALDFYPEWDALWKTGPYADIVVGFDDGPEKMVFWRGTNYNGNLVTENGIWVGDQSAEASTQWGCAEHMSDKQNRYSHVRLIENTPARVVIHWRYGLVDVTYAFAKVDPETGWGNWADEYYSIYPDGVAVRKIQIWGKDRHYSVTEPAILNPPGKKAEDAVELSAATLANLQGETHTYTWDPWPTATREIKSKRGARLVNIPLDRPAGATIAMLNTKSRYKPFYVYPAGSELAPYGAPDEVRSEYSRFPTWNHWPVNMAPSDGRYAFASDRFSSSAILSPDPVQTEGPGPTKNTAFLLGMTSQPVESIVTVARSWSNPASLALSGGAFRSRGYDRGERAYMLERKNPADESPLEFTLEAGPDSPVANPAFVIKGWGDKAIALTADGRTMTPGPDFRTGFVPHATGTDATVWLRMTATRRITIRLSPQ